PLRQPEGTRHNRSRSTFRNLERTQGPGQLVRLERRFNCRNNPMIDTLQEAKKLEQAGFAPEQAAAIVEVQWRSPSRALHNLERSGFERQQAEAILDLYWSIRSESLMRFPGRWGFVTGLIIILMIFGLYMIIGLFFGWHFVPASFPTPT